MGIIMQALTKGVAEWITALFSTAAKKGLAIFVLAGGLIGFAWTTVYLFSENAHLRDNIRAEFQAELAEARNEYRAKIADLERRLEACERERTEYRVRNAMLEGGRKR